MKKWKAIIVIAFWFSIWSRAGGISTVGPFDSKEECEKARDYIIRRIHGNEVPGANLLLYSYGCWVAKN
jgi:hypothetical protein